jgi:hypothetical protein
MLEAGIYHKASEASLASILAEGLKYGRQGRHSQEGRVPRVNEFLTKSCPYELRKAGLDRHKCTYGYLAVDRWIFDVDSGRLIEEKDWHVEQGMVKLQLSVVPQIAFVSDLDAYDELTERLGEAPQSTLKKLAQQYWQRIVALPDLCAHYRLEDHALVRQADGPPSLPSRLARVEVLLTADVPAEEIRRRPA